jgi:hypothetical protein
LQLDVALLAALVTVVLWASAFVGIRAAGEDLGRFALPGRRRADAAVKSEEALIR